MAKTKKSTVWQQIKDVWAAQVAIFLDGWKPLWDEYKTIIGPFVKGTFAYLWKIVSGIITILYNGIYGTGKVILNWLLEIIKKA